MNEKELELLMAGVAEKNKAAIKSEMEVAVQGLMTAKQFAERMETLGLKEDTLKSLTDAVEKQGLEMRSFFEKKATEEKSLDELIEENKKEIADLAKSNQRNSVKLMLPATMKTQVTRASVSGNTIAMRLPNIGELPYLGTVMSGLFRHAPMSPGSNGVIRYFDQNAITRNANTVAEGATKPESAITWIERTLSVQKIADSIPVTKEAFSDVLFIRSEIDRLLNINLALKEDEQLYDGDAPNLKGVYTSAVAFDPTAWVAGGGYQPADANLYDLLAIIRVSIANGKQSKYMPNFVLMNPADVLRYKLAKATNGHYILPPFISANGTVIDGMIVVESSQVDVNTLVVGDSRYGVIYDLEGVAVEMGWINDQFVKNAMTILAEKREALLIRTVDEDAFNKVTDITAAIATITV